MKALGACGPEGPDAAAPGRPGAPAGWPVPPGACGRGRGGRPCRRRVAPGGARGRGRGSQRKCTKPRRFGGTRLAGGAGAARGPSRTRFRRPRGTIPRPRASGGIGRRAGFRFLWAQACGGSSPPSPTSMSYQQVRRRRRRRHPRGAGRPDRDRGGGLCRHPGAVRAAGAPGVPRSGAGVRRRRGRPGRATGRHGAATRADRPSRHGVDARRTAAGHGGGGPRPGGARGASRATWGPGIATWPSPRSAGATASAGSGWGSSA